MTQLSFQPAFDAFHAVFRLLRLRDLVASIGPLPYQKIQILDFYLLFPNQIQNIRLAPRHQRLKKLSERYAHMKPYGELPDIRLLFERMAPMQTAAVQTLSAKSIISSAALEKGEVSATETSIPPELAERVRKINESEADLMEFLATLAKDYSLSGDNGLKARTGLMEHRYDAL